MSSDYHSISYRGSVMNASLLVHGALRKHSNYFCRPRAPKRQSTVRTRPAISRNKTYGPQVHVLCSQARRMPKRQSTFATQGISKRCHTELACGPCCQPLLTCERKEMCRSRCCLRDECEGRDRLHSACRFGATWASLTGFAPLRNHRRHLRIETPPFSPFPSSVCPCTPPRACGLPCGLACTAGALPSALQHKRAGLSPH